MTNFDKTDRRYYLQLSDLGKEKCGKIFSYFGLEPEYEKKQINFQRDHSLDEELKKIVKDSYRISDECFSLYIPKFYIESKKESLKEIYLRFIKISTMLLVEHTLLFDAFKIKPDEDAKRRSVLFSFFKRNFDDLNDTDNNSSYIRNIFRTGETNSNDPEHKLLAYFGRKIPHSIPLDKFQNFYDLLSLAADTQTKKPANLSLEQLKKIAFNKARYSFLVDSYVMIDNLPNEFIAYRKITAELFQCIDDMDDFAEDLQNGKSTYINQSPNPETTLRNKYAEICDLMMKNVQYSQLYLYLMRYFMERAIYKSANG